MLEGQPKMARNRMGRPLSPPQIHQRIIWMLSNFHKTTSERWQRTPGTQKGSPSLWKEVEQNIRERKKDKRIRDGDLSLGRKLWRRRNFQTVGNPLTGGSVGSFGNSEGNITGRKKKPTEYAPNCNCQWASSPEAHIHHQQRGLDREVRADNWGLG